MMAPAERFTSLTTSNASFAFVMRLRNVLLFFVKIWQSQSLSYPRANCPSSIEPTFNFPISFPENWENNVMRHIWDG